MESNFKIIFDRVFYFIRILKKILMYPEKNYTAIEKHCVNKKMFLLLYYVLLHQHSFKNSTIEKL